MTIYDNVFEAMQRAEELGGPLGDDYMKLMTDIAQEAINRMQTYRAGAYVDDLKEQLKIRKPKPMLLKQFAIDHNLPYEDVSWNGTNEPLLQDKEKVKYQEYLKWLEKQKKK